MASSPDGGQVLAGGSFTSMNGSTNPGGGMASLDAVTGANRPWAANRWIRYGGNGGGHRPGVGRLERLGHRLHAVRGGGTLEGSARMSWNGGGIEWVEDCHGDSYGVTVQARRSTWSATSTAGTFQAGSTERAPGLASWARVLPGDHADPACRVRQLRQLGGDAGADAAALVPGSTRAPIPASQAAWTIEGNSDYIVAGGEFPRVGGMAQQGLVRFAKKGVSGNPNDTGAAATDLGGSGANPP